MNEVVKKLYVNTTMLAPMVRMNSLPFRLLSHKYGCQTVFSEEIVAMKLITCTRKVNDVLGTIEYFDNKNDLVFQTTKEEKDRLVFQLGVPTPELAIQAAKVVEDDVSAFDINMGCPKQFSTKGCMGSALLKTPDIAFSIVKGLSSHTKLPVSCKIRLLDGEIEKTIDFMKGLIDNGASAITVHLRYTDDRPRVPCHKEYFPILFNAMKEYAPHIPICYNGDIFSHDDVQSLRALYPSIGLMIGRGAILNMGVFKGVQTSFDETNKEFIQLCAKFNNGFANTKYTAFRVITEGNHQTLDSSIVLHDAHDWETLGSAYGVGEECVRILEDLREKGLTIDENLRKNDGGQHRKSKKRNSANVQTLPSSSSDSKQSKQEEK